MVSASTTKSFFDLFQRITNNWPMPIAAIAAKDEPGTKVMYSLSMTSLCEKLTSLIENLTSACEMSHSCVSLFYALLEIPMKWSQLDQIWVDTDLVSWMTLHLLYLQADVNCVPGRGSWLGFSSHWGHHLASLSRFKTSKFQ
jgi:hypothetical protein